MTHPRKTGQDSLKDEKCTHRQSGSSEAWKHSLLILMGMVSVARNTHTS